MTWGAFLNNQTVKQATLLPNGEYGTATRYIFIAGRNLPIILTDEKSTVSQSWAVGVSDGKNPHYQVGMRDTKVPTLLTHVWW